MQDGDDNAVHGKQSLFYLLVLFLIQRLKHRRSGPGWAVAKTGGRPGGGQRTRDGPRHCVRGPLGRVSLFCFRFFIR